MLTRAGSLKECIGNSVCIFDVIQYHYIFHIKVRNLSRSFGIFSYESVCVCMHVVRIDVGCHGHRHS